MKFLIDGHANRVAHRIVQWPEGVAGQLVTPLTCYRVGHPTFAIDNGAYTMLRAAGFARMCARYEPMRPLFAAIPDKVGCHRTTEAMYIEHAHLAAGCVKAFVCQDGYDGHPPCAGALFIGGTNKFKDSAEALEIVNRYRESMHIHIGRVNGATRFWRFAAAGAHTCDGSGVSRFDHMIEAIRDA